MSARNDSLVWIEALVAVSGAGGGYSVTPAEGGRLVSSASANTKWCLGPEEACGSAMRCVPEAVDGSCCRWRPIMLTSVAATAARSAAEPCDSDRLFWPHRDGLIWPHWRRAGAVVTV